MISSKTLRMGMTLCAVLLTGCGKKDDTPAATTAAPPDGKMQTTAPPASSTANAQTIEGAGATFPAPIYKLWFDKYQQANQTAVNYQAVGSGEGYKALKDHRVAFGASDAPLTDAEEKALSAPVLHLPTVGGAVVICYNLPNAPTGLQFTPEAIAGIFLGKIKKWNDPAITSANPGKTLPDLNIQPVHRTDGSGTTYVFTNYLKKTSTEWAAGPGAGKSVNWPLGLGGAKNPGVAAVIKRTPGAVGYVELAFALDQKLPYAAVKNHEGKFVVPTVESTEAALSGYADALTKDIKTPTVDAPGAASYPICSLTYILLYKSGGDAGTANAAKLWAWAMDPAQQDMAKTLQYAPLPAALVKANLDALKTIEK